MTQRPMLRVLPFVVVGQSADLDLRAAVESAASYVQRMLPDGDEKSLNLAELTLVSTNTTVAGALAQGFAMHRLRVAAGGGAFLAAYPEVRQFLSAMRAIADRDDGAAQAALFAPPLFAIEPADFLASLAVKDDSHPPRARLKRAREVAEKIRQRRHMQSPGATARDLIEHSALGRVCAARVAGDLLLEALYETAGFLDKWASREGLDFDALADLCQVWADGGLPQSFAVPQGAAAASLMLVSDAAELRFRVACVVEASDSCLAAASNLATELVVLAVPVEVADVWTPPVQRFAAVERLATIEVRSSGAGVAWPKLRGDPKLQGFIDDERAAFLGCVTAATAPRAVPMFAVHAGEVPASEVVGELDHERAQKVAGARFGAIFGRTVRRALQMLLAGIVVDESEALRRGAVSEGLQQNLEEAAADVARAVRALENLGYRRASGIGCFEVALAAGRPGGTLLHGTIDVLFAAGTELLAIELRSDKPSAGALKKAHRRYAEQLALYGELLRASGLSNGKTLKLGVLMTASGEVRWL